MHLDAVKMQGVFSISCCVQICRLPGSASLTITATYGALVNAAVSLLTKTQRWDFSLREVARCAGVSHNAPYSHFASKRELLAAVAAKGYEILRARLLTGPRPRHALYRRPGDSGDRAND